MMTRRKDIRTAELVEIALLNRSAFEEGRAARYAGIAGIPQEVIERIFARCPSEFRRVELCGCAVPSGDRRKVIR